MAILMRLLHALAIVSLVGGAAVPAHSQQPDADAASLDIGEVDPARLDAARALMKAARTEDTISASVPVMVDQMMSVMEPFFGGLLDAKEKAEMVAMLLLIKTELAAQLSEKRGELVDLTALAYARILTAGQIDSLSRFYASPVGEKFIRFTPEMTREFVPVVAKLMSGAPIYVDQGVDPAAMEAARDMLQAGKTERMIDTVLSKTELAMTLRLLVGQKPAGIPTDGEPKAAEDSADREIPKPNLERRRGEMLDMAAAFWAKRLTVEEMRALAAFHRTEAGEAAIDAMPDIQAEQQRVTQPLVSGIVAELTGKLVAQMKNAPQ